MAGEPVRVQCPVCGETDPWPSAICLYRLEKAGREAMTARRQCSYSLEGDERLKARFAAKMQEIPDAE